MIRPLLLTLAILLSLSVFSQDIKRTAIWYFGQNAGIDFNTDPPTPLTNGAMNTEEGCATISDTNGNLLFYTNGEKIWNKNHQIMDNGDGLLGSWDATQSSIIIPQPDNDTLFYVFTTDAVGQANGLRYSIVNLNLDNGLGSVIAKNILLQTPVCEKLTATHHENGRDIWVMVHGFPNTKFSAYLITNKGLINCPVISEIGSLHGDDNGFGQPSVTDAQGAIKFSPNGKTLAVTVFGRNQVELFEFSKKQGLVQKHLTTLNSIFLPYGLEYSFEDKYLYVVDKGKNLYQYFLDTTIVLINSSKKIIYTHTSDALESLQLGSDRKIYQAVIQASFVARINRPDSSGDSSLYAYNGFNLGGKRSEYGLPNFITSYFHTPEIDFTYQTNCSDNTIMFTEKSIVPVISRKWKVIKENTLIDSSTLSNPSFTFSDTGTYKVQLIINTADTIAKEVLIEPPLIAKRDTIICNQSNYTMVIPDNYRCIMWLEGQDTNRYTVYNTGIYVVSAYNTKGCYVTDTAKVTFSYIGKPNIHKSNDTLYTDSSAAVYQWYFNSQPINNSNSQNIKITQNGIYKLTITNSLGCSNTSDNYNVSGLSIAGIDQLPFSIYPNPARGLVKVNFTTIDKPYQIKIFNAIGQEIYTADNSTENTLQIEIGKMGIYIVKITGSQSNQYSTKLVIN